MKKILLSVFAALAGTGAFAQTGTPFTAAEYIDISNIRARHMVHGDMWWNPSTGLPACEYPKGSGKNVSFAAALWIAGYDAQRNLHVSAQSYRQNGNDFWPGPLDAGSNATTYGQESDWARIWKINRTTIDSFRAAFTPGMQNIPDIIKRWPAKGNLDATGTSGGFLLPTLTNGRDYAPFVDVNNDGKYNAADGDYPDIKGDQMLWWVTNDAGTTHNAIGGVDPLGLEIHNSAYAYHRGGALDNIIFYEYKIYNRSNYHYDSLRVGLWADAELGYGFDDYIGYDSVRRMGVCYNAHPSDSVYGTTIPMMGVAMMELPDDSAASYAPAGSFSYYYNLQTGTQRNPQTVAEYNNLLSPAFSSGAPFPNGGRYAVSLSQECDNNYPAGDQRFIITSKARTLDGGNAMLKVGMALVVCPNAGGCPNLSFACLQAAADTAFTVYHHPLPSTGVAGVKSQPSLMLYPNPAQDHLFFQSGNGRSNGQVAVYDAAGRQVPVGIKTIIGGRQLDVSGLAAGVYTVRCVSADGTEYGTFVKR